jgi:hypothetical protein
VGLESCETVTIEFVSWLPPSIGGNEARIVSVESSIVETTGSVREELEVDHHLSVEKAHDSLQSYSTMVLGRHMGYPLRRGTNED